MLSPISSIQFEILEDDFTWAILLCFMDNFDENSCLNSFCGAVWLFHFLFSFFLPCSFNHFVRDVFNAFCSYLLLWCIQAKVVFFISNQFF